MYCDLLSCGHEEQTRVELILLNQLVIDHRPALGERLPMRMLVIGLQIDTSKLTADVVLQRKMWRSFGGGTLFQS